MTDHIKQWPTLFTKTAAGAINYWQIWTEGSSVHMRWGQVGTENPLTDSYEAEGKNVGRSNETSPVEQAQKEAQAKFDKQIRLKYVHSIEEAESNINIKPMRAYVLDAKRQEKLPFPVTVQPKFNGVRCMAYNLPDGSVRLMSRGGKDYTLQHIQDQLRGRIPAEHCLDGELYVHGVSLQTQRHYIETSCEETTLIQLVCYDFLSLPPAKREWTLRHEHLKMWFERNKDLTHVTMSPYITADDIDMVKRYHDSLVHAGYEGAMIRTPHGTYRLGARSKDLLKYKRFQDAEFEVVDWNVGRDGVIIFTCVQEQGRTFDVRPMGSAEERRKLLDTAEEHVGKLLTVRFQERSNDNIPIFPVGVAFRPEEDMD